MTQVNLLPTDVKVRQQTRRVTALVMAAGAAVFGLLFFVFVLQSARLVSAQHSLDRQTKVNDGLRTQISSLSRFQDLKQTVAGAEALVNEVSSGEVAWSGVLRDVSMVIPSQIYLSSMAGSIQGVSATSSTTTVVAGSGVVGNIQFQGISVDYLTVAKWLTRLEEVTGWVNSWVSQAAKDAANGGLVAFNGTIDLTADATVHGAPQ